MGHISGLDLGKVLGDVETVEILVPGDAIDHTGQLNIKIVLGHIEPGDTLDPRQSILHYGCSRSTNVVIANVQFHIGGGLITRQTQ